MTVITMDSGASSCVPAFLFLGSICPSSWSRRLLEPKRILDGIEIRVIERLRICVLPHHRKQHVTGILTLASPWRKLAGTGACPTAKLSAKDLRVLVTVQTHDRRLVDGLDARGGVGVDRPKLRAPGTGHLGHDPRLSLVLLRQQPGQRSSENAHILRKGCERNVLQRGNSHIRSRCRWTGTRPSPSGSRHRAGRRTRLPG